MNSLCSISGHGFRGKTKTIINLPPTAITSVAAPTVTATSIVFTWSGGLTQDSNTVTTTYTMNGSGATPSSSGIGTATFTGLTINTAYSFVVTATNVIGSKTGTITTSTLGLQPTNISSVLVPTITSTSAVVTWSGGLTQDSNTVTTTYTMNGSGATPSSSGIGTATFTGLTINTAYTFVVTASTAAGSRTGVGTINTTIVSNQLYYNFPFQNDLLDYHTGSGVSVGTLTYPAEIYWQSTGGYNSGGCLYCSVNLPDRRFVFPNTSFYQTMGFSVSFWYKGIKGYSDGIFVVGAGYNRYQIEYHSSNNCLSIDDVGDIGYTINENQWYHICWVVQPNTATSYFYFNGGSVNGGSTVSAGTITAKTGTLGGAAFDNNTGTEQAKGYMNNLNIFNYAITQSQITALWQA